MSHIGQGCFLTILTKELCHIGCYAMQQPLYLNIKKNKMPGQASYSIMIIKLLITACRYSDDVARAHGVDDAHAPRNPRASQGEPCERA